MSVLTRKATDKSDSQYRELPDGFVGRFVIGKPRLRGRDGKYGRYYLVDFPLVLTEAEQKRLIETVGPPPDGVFQSWGPAFRAYSCGWSLRPKRDSSWPVVDFLAAAFGSRNSRAVRDWIAAGGCPPERDEYTEEQNIEVIESWLGWVEGLEIYGTVRHDPEGYARFASPMAVGSLPGQPEPEYQADAKGKLRAMQGETAMAETAGPTEPAADGLPDPTQLTPEQRERYRELFGN